MANILAGRVEIVTRLLRFDCFSFLGVERAYNTRRLRQNTTQLNRMVFAVQICSSVANDYPLTKVEALSFITKTLKISKEQVSFGTNRLSLLSNIIRQMKSVVPFTNIPILIADKRSRSYPHNMLIKCKEDVISCQGGQCYWINSFMKHLLTVIGYDTEFFGAGNRAESLLYDLHPGVIARDVSYPGSIHLVEAGNTHPVFEAIPLDFEDFSPSYIYGNNVYKYFNCGRGIFKYCIRLQKDVNSSEPWKDIVEAAGESWKLITEYRTAQVEPFSHFTTMAELLLSNELLLPKIHNQFRIFGYPNGKYVFIDEHNVTTMNKTGGYNVTPIHSSHDLIENVKKYFPQILEENVVKSINTSHKCEQNRKLKNDLN